MTDPYYRDEQVTVYAGDCLDVMAALPDASVDAVVTDPPYGLEFMGKDWDRFSGAVTDRDFKGFVLSQQRTRNVKCPECGKWAYDHPGRLCECGGVRRAQGNTFQQWCQAWAVECLRLLKPGGHMLAFGGTRTGHRLAAAIEDAGFEIRDSIAWLYGSGFPKSLDVSKAIDKAAGVERDAAKRWQGWGTALKPAFEPIVVARKPLTGTVAANVTGHGTGALNIDACRVATDQELTGGRRSGSYLMGGCRSRDELVDLASRDEPTPDGKNRARAVLARLDQSRDRDPEWASGRWPTNVVIDEHTAAQIDEQTGVLKSGANPTRRGSDKFRNAYGDFAGQEDCVAHRGADEGGASRFFPTFRYEAKAPTTERPTAAGAAHPTVKPLDLMRWLVRLVTPPHGLVLDPFAGSGTTAEACIHEHMRCITIERETDYLPLIMARLSKPMAVGFDFEEPA